jgi:hypothetical protein
MYLLVHSMYLLVHSMYLLVHSNLSKCLPLHSNCLCPLPDEVHSAVRHDPVKQLLPVLTTTRPVKCSIAARQAEGAQCGELGVGRYHRT